MAPTPNPANDQRRTQHGPVRYVDNPPAPTVAQSTGELKEASRQREVMQRICPGCGQRISRVGEHNHRPSAHQRGLGADHRRIRAQVLAEESVCWICGRPGTTADRLEADHVLPRAQGGRNVRDNYRAAHRSCNARRGNTTQRVAHEHDEPVEPLVA